MGFGRKGVGRGNECGLHARDRKKHSWGPGGGGGGMVSGVGEVTTGGGGMLSTGSGGIRCRLWVVMVSDGEIFTRQMLG